MAFPTHESKRALMNFLVETKKFEGMLQNNWYGFIEGSWKCELNGSYAKLNPVSRPLVSKMLLKQYREVSIVHLKDFIDLVRRCLSIVMYAGRFFSLKSSKRADILLPV